MTRSASTAFVVVTLATLVGSCGQAQPSDQKGASSTGRGATLTAGAPTAESLAQLLGVPVDVAQGETNQYLIRAPQGSVDLTKVGTIEQDLGYAVGVTLPNGVQIGFRYEPLTSTTPTGGSTPAP